MIKRLTDITINPLIELPEDRVLGIGEYSVNDAVQVLLNFVVVEKTKNFVVLRVSGASVLPSKRKM